MMMKMILSHKSCLNLMTIPRLLMMINYPILSLFRKAIQILFHIILRMWNKCMLRTPLTIQSLSRISNLCNSKF